MQENRELSLNTRPQAPSLPLDGSAVLNDTPVACQTREPTDPQGDRWHGEAVTDIVSRPGASAFFVSDSPISSNSGRNGGKNAGRNCVSALPQRAMPVRCRPRFPSRNRRFPDRCRSPDCASTAFRCRCLLLWQKLFVLLRRRLLYPVPDGHTYLCRRKAAKARFDNRHSTSAPIPTLTVVSGSGARGTSDPPNRQRPPPHQFREASTAKFALARPAPRDP